MFAGVDTRPRQQPKVSNTSNHHRSRSNSQSRSERRGSHGETGHRQLANGRSPSRADLAAGLKASVPQTTIPHKPSNLKHQMSQSTLSDKENVDFGTQIKQEPYNSVNTVPSEVSAGSDIGQQDMPIDNSTQMTMNSAGWEEDEIPDEHTTRFVGQGANLQRKSIHPFVHLLLF
jgi:hypothetical protein